MKIIEELSKALRKRNDKLWQPKPAEQEVDWLNLGNALHKNLTQEQHRAIDQFINLVKQLWEREK